MGKSQETFNKKEKEKKRLKKNQEKQQRREERKLKPKEGGLENMMAYVDENGDISDTPPDPTKKKKINPKKIETSVPKRVKEDIISTRKGRVDFFNNEKGFGFIKEQDSREKYFFHISAMLEEVNENDMVIFELERGLKGMNAVRVKKQ